MSESSAHQCTVFHSYHLEQGAKMVPFAGYSMPVHYPLGIMEEHLHTRANAGLFDVSHMGQLVISGEGAQRGLERLIPIDLDNLGVDRQSYGLLTNEQGGILDDLIITRWDHQRFFVVVNAACVEQDINHLRQHMPDVEIQHLSGRGLLALQGPKAAAVLTQLAPEVSELRFMQGRRITLQEIDCYITRSGYTGEDGFEISVDPQQSKALADQLLAFDWVQWIGLGARDSLRLEAGLCLYGHDLDQQTTPVEAGLTWSISKSRRQAGSKAGGFLGAETILPQIANGAAKKRVAFEVDGRAPVREGAEIVNLAGETVGVITSGGFAPSLQRPIAMGYVTAESAALGTQLRAIVRGKPREIRVAAMPLVPHNYQRN